MLRLISVVTLLLIIQHCGAQLECTDTNKAEVCKPELHTVATCTNFKCECAPGYALSTDGKTCQLIILKITGDGPDNKYYLESKTTFTCNTNVPGSSSYEWRKDGTVVAGFTTIKLTIDEATEANSGTYICKIPDKTAESAPFVVSFEVKPGKVCTEDTDCTGEGYTQKCDTTKPTRCICADGYKQKDTKCSNSATSLTTSILLLGAAIFSLRVNTFGN